MLSLPEALPVPPVSARAEHRQGWHLACGWCRASAWGHWCVPCVMGKACPHAGVQQTGPGMLPAPPVTPQGLWEPRPQDQHCQKEGGRHVVRFWLLPCLETLVGGGSIKLP